MLFLYILAFFTMSNGFCLVCLELMDMREARRKGQNATWYKAARVGIGHLLYALSLLLFGKYMLNLYGKCGLFYSHIYGYYTYWIHYRIICSS
jgi:hypothetical protein